jgi:K+-transporting ATPase A subunit
MFRVFTGGRTLLDPVLVPIERLVLAETATFGFTLWSVVVILGLLMFMPVAVLGPIAEHLALR